MNALSRARELFSGQIGLYFQSPKYMSLPIQHCWLPAEEGGALLKRSSSMTPFIQGWDRP